MSGVEAAGLVLSALPIITSALEQYEKVEEFLRWREKLASLKWDLWEQHSSFHMILEILLGSIANEADRNEMLKDPQSDHWKRGTIHDALREWLGHEHTLFMATLNRIEDTTKAIGHGLGLPGEVTAQRNELEALVLASLKHTQPSLAPFELRQRLKFMMRKKELYMLCAKIKTSNDILKNLLHLCREREKRRKIKLSLSPAFVPSLDRLRHHANSVHSAVGSALSCGHNTHRVGLILEGRIIMESERLNTRQQELIAFNMVFEHPNQDNVWRSSLVEVFEDSSNITTTTPVARSIPSYPTSSDSNPITSGPVRDLCLSTQKMVSTCLSLQLKPPGVLHCAAPPLVPPATSSGMIVTLSDVLRDAPMFLMTKRRYRLAVVVVSSFLQLSGTPWLSSGLNKNNICFFRTNSEVMSVDINRPFVLCDCSSPGSNAKSAFASIRNGNERTHFLHLGLLLLEIQLCKRIEDCCPIEHEWDTPTLMNSWMAKEDGNISHTYHGAISYCMGISRDDTSDVHNLVFFEKLKDHILAPLQSELRIWEEGHPLL